MHQHATYSQLASKSHSINGTKIISQPHKPICTGAVVIRKCIHFIISLIDGSLTTWRNELKPELQLPCDNIIQSSYIMLLMQMASEQHIHTPLRMWENISLIILRATINAIGNHTEVSLILQNELKYCNATPEKKILNEILQQYRDGHTKEEEASFNAQITTNKRKLLSDKIKQKSKYKPAYMNPCNENEQISGTILHYNANNSPVQIKSKAHTVYRRTSLNSNKFTFSPIKSKKNKRVFTDSSSSRCKRIKLEHINSTNNLDKSNCRKISTCEILEFGTPERINSECAQNPVQDLNKVFKAML